MVFRKGLRLSYAISIGTHLLILLILAFIYYRVPQAKSWHEFEWLSPPDFVQELDKQERQGFAEAAPSIPSSGAQALSPQHSQQPKPGVSNLIESPVIDHTSSQPGAFEELKRGTGSDAFAAVGDHLANPGHASGYNASLVSGAAEAYIIRQNPPKISPLSDDEVLIDFKLSESGRVLMNSVNVLAYKESAHWEAIRREMPSWRFGFKGQYHQDRIYRIRVVFRVR